METGQKANFIEFNIELLPKLWIELSTQKLPYLINEVLIRKVNPRTQVLSIHPIIPRYCVPYTLLEMRLLLSCSVQCAVFIIAWSSWKIVNSTSQATFQNTLFNSGNLWDKRQLLHRCKLEWSWNTWKLIYIFL